MAAFRAGIRWADMSTESFSRSKTAPGSTANAALLLQAEQADQSYAPGEAVVLPEFENSQAGMNQYFLAAAALGEDSSKPGAPCSEGTDNAAAACSSIKSDSSKASPAEERKGAEKMPGFKGLLVGSPNDGSSSGAGEEHQTAGRRERNLANGALDSATLTPAKRNRRTSDAPSGGPSAVMQNSEAPAQDGCSSAAQEVPCQRLPHSKRRKSALSRRSVDGQFPEKAGSIDAAIVSHGQQAKRRSAKGANRRRSGTTRTSSEGSSSVGLLLQMGAPAFLQLPGLVSPMFMPDEASADAPASAEAQSATSATEETGSGQHAEPYDPSDQQDLEAILAFNKECELAGL
ncbi:hypothetical protein cyc_04881 [Cyclospora cayetanensis]|uniref:Uncharacterized protein n=1 Tax=Cyclospora cayetanensis TaxID=88456 RepID=A0A1D3CW06_9EIME|nr:hypothetical protein cyc_04881 [Cyclospora cayetanensis]